MKCPPLLSIMSHDALSLLFMIDRFLCNDRLVGSGIHFDKIVSRGDFHMYF